MKIRHFSIYDKKAQTFGQVFPSHSFGTAERELKSAISNTETQIAKYPDDFALYYHFEFDGETGDISDLQVPPQLIVEASALA